MCIYIYKIVIIYIITIEQLVWSNKYLHLIKRVIARVCYKTV